MKELEFEQYFSELLERKQRLDKLLPPAGRRRRSSRSPEEAFILTLLDVRRWERALASGKIEVTGPREFKIPD
jgi:hypothetical protein